jgi:hypothetical protein
MTNSAKHESPPQPTNDRNRAIGMFIITVANMSPRLRGVGISPDVPSLGEVPVPASREGHD